MSQRKRQKISPLITQKSDLFEEQPDDIVVCILCKLSSSASCPSDFINILVTCKRLNRLALHPQVLSKAGPKTFAIRAKNWSDSAHRFLKQCVNAGNTEASYTLGMIQFYCLQNRASGASLMAKAAIKSHAPALYSLAVMQFNGSGGSKNNKDLRAGVSLCARAAVLGHIDALRELGHCLQDGYGVAQNTADGRRLLIQANARELASSLRSMLTWQPQHQNEHQWQQLPYASCVTIGSMGCPLLSDFGCNVPAREVHPANRFLREWFESGIGVMGPNLRLCSHSGCGRPETRPHEFRRCSVCGKVNYCSRGCQAIDWKLRHKVECVPMELWHGVDGDDNEIGGMVEIEEG
ncbi:F-box protein At5g50450 [Manihot esculenta]|uniref:Uncharacterized protein n=1 Tax=Manihot esculenta TaxID=3983 RepID=A0ACB7GFV5_MANES|nr:F-box protein At5g50450 [Manihot esculenta]KAG8638669.1 hypothetical protein MANES_14G051300v8 [Manihot esculenta]